MANSKSFYFWLWLCISVSLSFSSKAVDCSTDTVGLCTPTIEEIIDEVITETIEYEADGHTVTTTTDTTTTTTTVTNEDSGNILDGDNGYVSSTKEGDMDSDWGGQGPANMPSGNNCYGLGTDKCAQITGSGNSTSSMGVDGMGTTFINTVDISSLDIENGGRTNYTIKVDKQDAQDRIYMHITGRNGKTNVFSGTDILSESGVASGYQTYESGFDFSGTITTLIIEVGGRDINMAIGPLFDDITINVLYNVISTIVQQSITSVEMWVAYGGSTETEIIDIVDNIIDHNDFVEQPTGEIEIEPIQEPDTEVSYEMVEIEMEMEMPVMEIEIPEMEIEMPEIEMASVETEIEMEMEMEMEIPEPEVVEPEVETQPEPEVNEPEPEPEPEVSEPEQEEVQDEPAEENTEEPKEDVAKEPEAEESPSEVTKNEDSEEDMEEAEDKDQDEVKKEESKKEVAAKKILKKMGDKGRYDSANQLKTLIVMQVLGNSKSFFDSQQSLNDIEGFFTDNVIPDAKLTTNNIAQYFLFAGSDGLMNEIIMQQWQQISE
jgi:outer membrane biosynthesis protein TonB